MQWSNIESSCKVCAAQSCTNFTAGFKNYLTIASFYVSAISLHSLSLFIWYLFFCLFMY